MQQLPQTEGPTMKLESTTKALAERMLKHYRISKWVLLGMVMVKGDRSCTPTAPTPLEPTGTMTPRDSKVLQNLNLYDYAQPCRLSGMMKIAFLLAEGYPALRQADSKS